MDCGSTVGLLVDEVQHREQNDSRIENRGAGAHRRSSGYTRSSREKAPIEARKAATAAKGCDSREVEIDALVAPVGWDTQLVLYPRATGCATGHSETLPEASNQGDLSNFVGVRVDSVASPEAANEI